MRESGNSWAGEWDWCESLRASGGWMRNGKSREEINGALGKHTFFVLWLWQQSTSVIPFLNFSLTNRWRWQRRWNVSSWVTPSKTQQLVATVWWLDGGAQTTMSRKLQMSWGLSMWRWSKEWSATLLNITANLSMLSPETWYVLVQRVKTWLIAVRWVRLNFFCAGRNHLNCYLCTWKWHVFIVFLGGFRRPSVVRWSASRCHFFWNWVWLD